MCKSATVASRAAGGAARRCVSAAKRRPRAGTRGRLESACGDDDALGRDSYAGTHGLVDDVLGHERPEVLARGGEGPRTSGKARLTELFDPLGDESEPGSPDRVCAEETGHLCFRLGSQGASAAVSAPQRRKVVTSGIGTGSCRRRSRRHPARPRYAGAGCTWRCGRCGRARRS